MRKVHWITSPGLGGGRWPVSGLSPPEQWRHDPPLVFDVEADPSETFPVAPEQVCVCVCVNPVCACGEILLACHC